MSGSGTSLAPGFRFHPTDEELVRYYLRRKICGKSFRFNAISDVDIYKLEPWDLPGKSILKTRDLEWYFFSGLDKKYGNGSRTNRATDRGYWKTTGKDRAVYHNSKIAGMKKTLVYHTGRAPRGERTNWVMHEYRLIDEDFQKDGIAQEAFVLCRIFQKSGSGPKNGEQYGAPFVEEEWEEDEVAVIPGEQSSEEVAISDDAYVEINELEQKLATCIPPQNAQLPLNVYGGDTSNHVADPKNISEDNDQKPTVVAEEFDLWNLTGDQQYYDVSKEYELDSCHIVGENVVDSSIKMNLVDADYLLNEPYYDANDVPPFDDGLFLETNDLTNNAEADQQFYDVPEEYELDSCHVVGENVVDSSIKMNLVDADYLLNEPYYDANDVPPFDDGLFLETNDLTNNAEADSSSLDMLEEYLAYFDAYGNSISMVPDYPDMRSSESILSDSTSLTQKQVDGGMMQQQLANTQGSDVMSFSNEMSEDAIFHSEFKHSFASQATRMLGNIPARPAYASEFPSKAAALQLASLAGSLSLSHVTTQKVEKGDTDNGFTWSLDKNGNLELLLSFPLRQGEVSSTSVASLLARKTASAVSCGWCYLIFGLSVLSISLKIGSFMCAK